jgi:ferritin
MSEFIKFQEYIKRLRDSYFYALCAFYSFEAMEDMKSIKILTKKQAEENVEVMQRFKNFFVITNHALNFYFLMELAKILDDAKQSLHLNKLINFANSNKKKINVSEFKKLNSDRAFLDNLIARYNEIEKEDIKKINDKLEKTKKIRDKIKRYRDQNLAHEDLRKEKINITSLEIIKIFELIAEILDIFSYKTDFSITSYTHVEDECKRDAKNIIKALKRFESYRLEEINKKV